MKFLEKDLENIIYDAAQTNIGREKLRERGLDLHGVTFRQVDLGDYGIADLVNIHVERSETGTYWRFSIIELKKGKIDINAVMQACRYKTALRKFVLKHFDASDYSVSFNIVMIGDSIEKDNDFVFLYNFLRDVKIYTYDYKLSGLFFYEVPKRWIKTNGDIANNTKLLLTKPGFSLLRKILSDSLPAELPF